MKSTIISMLIVLILLVVLPMIFLGDFGGEGTLAERFGFDFFRPKAASGVKLPSKISSVTTDKPVQMYKWRDEHGVVQFSSTPPTGIEAERMSLTPNLNTMQAVKPPKQEPKAAVASTEPSNPYTPGGMKKLLQQAGSVKQQMDQQQADQQKALDGIMKGSR